MHNHEHCHHNFKFCSSCDLVYCKSCDKEWQRKYNYSFTTTNAGIGGSYALSTNAVNTNLVNTVSDSTVINHETH